MPCVTVVLTLKSGRWADERNPLLGSCFSDHYVQVLVCQHECVRELATRPGRLSPIENFLPLHYDYLQFAYYRGKAWIICEKLWGEGVWLITRDIEFLWVSPPPSSVVIKLWVCMHLLSHLTSLQLRTRADGETTSGQMLWQCPESYTRLIFYVIFKFSFLT